MKIHLTYEIEPEDYEEFLNHDLVQDEPVEFFSCMIDDYAPMILTGFRIEKD